MKALGDEKDDCVENVMPHKTQGYNPPQGNQLFTNYFKVTF
jgi:hypothetical protein